MRYPTTFRPFTDGFHETGQQVHDWVLNREMVQCLDSRTGQPLVGMNTVEHSYLQLAASVLGRNIMREFINNARAGLDWLAAQPAVDAARLAVTGNSGGGHLTQALIMTDDRVRAAMSCCSQTTRELYLLNGVRAYDGEQNYFGCIPAGLDYDDFFAAFAPRPVRIGATAHDFYAIEGVLEVVARARRIYGLLGATDNIDLCLADDELHGYSAPLRRGCVEWFARHLMGRSIQADAADPPVESPDTLQCTRSGQVLLDYPDSPSILDLLRTEWKTVRRTAHAAPPLSRAWLRQCLKLPAVIRSPSRVRRAARTIDDVVTVDRLFFFSEPDIIVTGVLYTPSAPITQATLLLIPDGTEGQRSHLDRIHECLADSHLVLVFDPRGTGAVRMRRRNPGEGLAFRSTEYRVANDHFQLGTSLAARRAFDVLKACAYLRELQNDRSPGHSPVDPCGSPGRFALPQIIVEAHGWPAIYGILAAAADESVAFAACSTGLPESWADVFALQRRDPERFSESLIVPELGGVADIAELLSIFG